ncbi:MAG: hypothetical protein RIR51_267 [Bacteroidota bacterium]|jgi:hypothetical protein
MKNLFVNKFNLILEAYHYAAKSFVRFFHLANNENEKKEWENYLVKFVLIASSFLLIFPTILDGFEKNKSLTLLILILNLSFLILGKLVSPKAPLN